MVKKINKNIDFSEVIEDRFSSLVAERDETIKVIRTGSVSLDVSLGVGGIPLRRFTEIYGSEGSGKTTLALSIVKNAIESGYKVLYCDPEQGLDLGRAKTLVGDSVYDKDKFILVQPEFMEDALAVCEAAIDSKEFGLVVLDSIASMSPKIVKEKNLDDSTMAIIARRLGVFLTRNLYSVRNNDVAFVGLNQVRDKFGAYVPTYETPGGHQWKHDVSIRIMLSKAAEIKQGANKVGIQVKFVTKKNKVAPPFRSFTFPLLFDSGVDTFRDIVDFGTTMGVLKKRGGYYVFDDDTLGNGTINTIEFLKSNKDTLDKVLDRCYNLTNSMVMNVEEEGYYEEESES